MATELHKTHVINCWEEVPTVFPICNDIEIQHLRNPEFSFDYQDQYHAIHEIEPGILILFSEEEFFADEYIGSCILIARREDLISHRRRNYRYIVVNKIRRVRGISGFRNLIALEVKRLRSL